MKGAGEKRFTSKGRLLLLHVTIILDIVKPKLSI